LDNLCTKDIKSQRKMKTMNLKETFEKYVESIQNSDLEELFSTVTEDEKVLFLNAYGNKIDTREGYYEFHEEWFKSTDWEMPVELLEVHEGAEYGYTVALFHFRQKAPEGVYDLDSYFTLIFRQENGEWKVVADFCTPIKRTLTEGDTSYDFNQLYLFNTMKARRTVRKFKADPVPEEHVLKILDAARCAPTARNKQPWKFLVVQDREKLDMLKEEAIEWFIETHGKEKSGEELGKFREAVIQMAEGALSAPVYVAVLVPEYVIYDGVLAAGYLMIAAKALGYGTGFFTRLFPEEKMKEFFDIPNEYNLICFTPIGIPDGERGEIPKKDLKDFVVFDSFRE